MSLTKNKERALAALLSSKTMEEAAQKCNLSMRSLRNYKNDPEFAAALDAAEHEKLGNVVRMLSSGFTETIESLQEIIRNGVAESARVAASRAVLEYGLRYNEAFEIHKRLDALEAQIREARGEGWSK